jgi:hypothetical protein
MCRTPVINEFPASEDVFFGYGNQQLRDLPAQSEETSTYAKSKAFQYLLCFFSGAGIYRFGRNRPWATVRRDRHMVVRAAAPFEERTFVPGSRLAGHRPC